jgi:subtilisin family serine protease
MTARSLRRGALAASAAALLAAGTAIAVPATAAETGDPLAEHQWGLDQVRAPAAWGTSTGDGVVIAIVDTGVDLGHPDLAGQLVGGATFTCGDEPAPCGNGDWVGPDGEAQSNDTHGTHVAGIAAAATGNGIGIAGTAPDAKLMPVKVLEDGSGSFEEIAAGIRWAADQGADVINLSLGALPGVQALTFTGVISETSEAVAYARSQGAVVVAAAGNDFQFPLCGTPAFEDGALCVTATDKREAPAAYSNWGLKPDLQAVAAPGGSLLPICGEDVLSTVPRGTGNAEVCGYGTDYDEYAGTSMAAPHVSGVAALLAAQGRTDTEVLEVLLTTSRQPVGDARGVFTPNYGWGIVDAEAAVAAPGGSGTGTTDGGTTDGGTTDGGADREKTNNKGGNGHGKGGKKQ